VYDCVADSEIIAEMAEEAKTIVADITVGRPEQIRGLA
jgi:hypothetical protein